VAFIVAASDLAPITPGNDMSKYADDIILIVPSTQSSTCAHELAHIEQWSARKNLRLNRLKSVEMVFRARGVRLTDIPPPLNGIARVTEMRVLGVVIGDDFKVTPHIAATVASCERSLYALRVMKSHGMQQDTLQAVFRATTLSKLTYCSPAWWGYTTAGDRDRIEGFLRRCKRFGYYGAGGPSFAETCSQADNSLLNNVLHNSSHVLHCLLPPKSKSVHDLRPRRHDRVHPAEHSRFNNCNFISRMLRDNRCVLD
jgi:hypothetical protein